MSSGNTVAERRGEMEEYGKAGWRNEKKQKTLSTEFEASVRRSINQDQGGGRRTRGGHVIYWEEGDHGSQEDIRQSIQGN